MATAGRYRFGSKEHETMHGLNAYDFGPRLLAANIPHWDSPDRKQESYYPFSPNLYCAANPIRNTDPTGEDVCVLLRDNGMHIAMLIQNEDKKWAYFSMNGDGLFNKTSGYIGGCNIDNLGEKTFESPQEFLDSRYNQMGSISQIETGTTCGYVYNKGYIIESNALQDMNAAKTFKSNADHAYNLISNNCSDAVWDALESMKIVPSLSRELKNFETPSIELNKNTNIIKNISTGFESLLNNFSHNWNIVTDNIKNYFGNVCDKLLPSRNFDRIKSQIPGMMVFKSSKIE